MIELGRSAENTDEPAEDVGRGGGAEEYGPWSKSIVESEYSDARVGCCRSTRQPGPQRVTDRTSGPSAESCSRWSRGRVAARTQDWSASRRGWAAVSWLPNRLEGAWSSRDLVRGEARPERMPKWNATPWEESSSPRSRRCP